jgi:hypothetical protein
MRGAFGGEASWQGGIFENEYVARMARWRISRQNFAPMLLGPYGGWRAFRSELPLVPYHFRARGRRQGVRSRCGGSGRGA